MKVVGMFNSTAVLIAFYEQDNLGIGYISSTLLENEVDIRIIDFQMKKKDILKELNKIKPSVVGFSIIFQFHIDIFKELIDYLRLKGIKSHFTAGGHFPSMRYSTLLDTIPNLDSVVLFEGEYTFLELVQKINNKEDWRDIKGISYRKKKKTIVNELRPIENDLDNFPIPVRQPLKKVAFGKKYATIIAGRGCFYNCSFCSISKFYSKSSGPLKRIRQPEMVVREMELLHEEKDCSIYLFQDDDFPLSSKKDKDWVNRFCGLLRDKGLSNKIMWKINCRVDEIEEDLLTTMKKSGLYYIYLGIEDGTKDGLELLNKHITPQMNIEAIEIIKKLNLNYAFGFMLFNPESTFESVNENLMFLRKICGDGSSPITFCKMLPYAETQIEHKLKKEGRLIEVGFLEDYNFYDSRLGRLHLFMQDCFAEWINEHDGLLNMIHWSTDYLLIYKKYFQVTLELKNIEKKLIQVISKSNNYFLKVSQNLVEVFSSSEDIIEDLDILKKIKRDVFIEHEKYRSKILDIRKNIEELAKI